MRYPLEHSHAFDADSHSAEKRTFYALLLTVVVMVIEITAGSIYGSMALLADGWHMSTHAAAFCITLFAYYYAKKNADNRRFSFGTGKVSVLGGYTSAVALGIVALIMFVESIHRLLHPEKIQFNEAILVAVVGFVVNVLSICLLHDHHSHDHDHDHDHHHHKQDYNLRAAYIHVLADALTSILAIIALTFGKYYGWNWLDALMGIVGGFVICNWTLSLMKQTSPILLDENISEAYRQQVVRVLSPYAQVKDIHIWKISSDRYSAAITLLSTTSKSVQEYKQLLSNFDEISHLTVEVHYE